MHITTEVVKTDYNYFPKTPYLFSICSNFSGYYQATVTRTNRMANSDPRPDSGFS